MRDKHYKLKSYRLDDKIIKQLEELRYKNDITYNLLFKELIERYDKNN